jgi:hypothetical protein
MSGRTRGWHRNHSLFAEKRARNRNFAEPAFAGNIVIANEKATTTL